MLGPALDLLRGWFVYIVAFLLPLAGAVMAIVRFAEGDRDEASRIAIAALLGTFAYALVLTA